MPSDEPLHTVTSGRGSTVVLVHGFTQTGACWGAFGRDLERDHLVRRVDLPGHGRSGHDESDLWEAARLVGEAGGRATYLGYSMGGRVCLHLALLRPDLVERLVLVGATPGIEDPAARVARAEADDALAARLERIGVDAFLDEWLSQPLFEGLAPSDRCLEARRSNRPEGLAASLRHAGTGRQAPLWGRLAELAMPSLWVAGQHDPKFLDIATRVAETSAEATAHAVPGAGHTAHLESPAELLGTLRAWLDPADGPPP